MKSNLKIMKMVSVFFIILFALIIARCGGGDGDDLSPPGGPLIAPTGVSTTAGDEEIIISWDSVTDATSYNIYWSTSSGVSKTIYEGKIVDITTNSYTHTGLTNDTYITI